MNASALVVVRSRDDLDDFITGEGEVRDILGRAGHKVAVEHAQDGFVSNDEEIVLFTLKL